MSAPSPREQEVKILVLYMKMNIIHNEVKANPVLESKFSNVITNKKNKLFG